MSKFDAVLKKIEEALPAASAQNQQKWDPQTGLPLNQAAMDQWNKMPEAERKKREQGADKFHNQLLNQQPAQQQSQAQQQKPQQNQALQQLAQSMGIDAAELQKAIEALKQQQKQPTGNQQTNQQPAV